MEVKELVNKEEIIAIPIIPKESRHYQTCNLDDAYEQGWNDLQKCIENLPLIHIKKGHWIKMDSWSEGAGMAEDYGYWWKCDQCGREIKGDWTECGENFCPQCGSDNRGRVNG